MYFVSFVAFFSLVSIDVIQGDFSHLVKFITAFLTFACGYGATFLYCSFKKNAHKTLVRRTMVFLFAAYLIIVIDFMLIDTAFGRNISNIFASSQERVSDYMANKINLIPFATIKLFCVGYHNNWVSLSAFVENIIGNIAVFMPFVLFLPVIFHRINNAFKFFIVISVVIICMEFLQILFLTGSADIDDYILNISGAMAAYGFSRIKVVGRFLNRLTFGVWCYEDK